MSDQIKDQLRVVLQRQIADLKGQRADACDKRDRTLLQIERLDKEVDEYEQRLAGLDRE